MVCGLNFKGLGLGFECFGNWNCFFQSLSRSLYRLMECMLHISSVSVCIFWRWNTQTPGFECETQARAHRMAINFTFNWLSISFNRKIWFRCPRIRFITNFRSHTNLGHTSGSAVFLLLVSHAFEIENKTNENTYRADDRVAVLFSIVSYVVAFFSTVENLVFDMNLMQLFIPILNSTHLLSPSTLKRTVSGSIFIRFSAFPFWFVRFCHAVDRLCSGFITGVLCAQNPRLTT